MTYISIEIIGGLGNHLFQIAFLHYFKMNSKSKRDLIFKYEKECYNAFSLTRKTFWDSLFQNQFNILHNIDDIDFNIIYYEKNNHKFDNNLPLNIEKNILFRGYFQSFEYINDKLREDLIHIIYSNEDLMYKAYEEYNKIKVFFGENTEDDDIVSLHFRRTDYTKVPDFHKNLSMDYYRNALNIIKRKYLVIFSDDIDWCKLNIDSKLYNYDNIYFVEFGNVEIEFLVMSMIKHNIIANSTFSLWASFISSYNDKIIVAPKQWYGQKGSQEWNEIYHKYITNII